MRGRRAMQDEMTGRETLDPETGLESEGGQELSEMNPTHAELEQVKGERDQMLDRLARLQASSTTRGSVRRRNGPMRGSTRSRIRSSRF